MDYSKTYRKVAYFGLWAEETADSYGIRDSLNVGFRSWMTNDGLFTRSKTSNRHNGSTGQTFRLGAKAHLAARAEQKRYAPQTGRTEMYKAAAKD
jgi:hypothetical protein